MASPSPNIPSLSSLTTLLGKVVSQYEKALAAKSINYYPSRVTVQSQEIAGPSSSTSIPWTIRCVPALLEKAKEKQAKEPRKDRGEEEEEKKKKKGPEQNRDDVFAPPYQPDLLVEELPQHTFLLNKFCVVPRHFLLVTRDFQPQTMPPSPDTLAIAYRILCAHQNLRDGQQQQQGTKWEMGKGKELLAFYNCGQLAGASQPHQHMQFAELGGEDEVEAADGNKKARCSIPVEELLERIARDGKEEENVHALPLPYQHFVGLLGRANVEDEGKLCDYLGMKLLSLLDALFQARLTAETQREASNGLKKSAPAYNLLMTTRAMHLIPRQQEEFTGLRSIEGTADMVESGVELVGNLSINSLGYAGHLLVKSQEELDTLLKYPGGMVKVLAETGVSPVADVTAAAEEA